MKISRRFPVILTLGIFIAAAQSMGRRADAQIDGVEGDASAAGGIDVRISDPEGVGDIQEIVETGLTPLSAVPRLAAVVPGPARSVVLGRKNTALSFLSSSPTVRARATRTRRAAGVSTQVARRSGVADAFRRTGRKIVELSGLARARAGAARFWDRLFDGTSFTPFPPEPLLEAAGGWGQSRGMNARERPALSRPSFYMESSDMESAEGEPDYTYDPHTIPPAPPVATDAPGNASETNGFWYLDLKLDLTPGERATVSRLRSAWRAHGVILTFLTASVAVVVAGLVARQLPDLAWMLVPGAALAGLIAGIGVFLAQAQYLSRLRSYAREHPAAALIGVVAGWAVVATAIASGRLMNPSWKPLVGMLLLGVIAVLGAYYVLRRPQRSAR